TCTASAEPAAVRDGGVSPLPGAAARTPIAGTARDDRGADAGTDQRDDRVLRATPGAEPHLGLAEGLGAVVDVYGDVGARTQHRLHGYAVPPDHLCVDEPVFAGIDDAGKGHARAEDAVPSHAGLSGDGRDAVEDILHDRFGRHAVALDRVVGLG